MLIITIQPCLLGFYVTTRNGNHGFIREVGVIGSFGEVAKNLIFTEQDFILELK